MTTTPKREPQSEYDRNSNLAEAFGWVLLGGLAVELVFAFILDKPPLERYSTIIEDSLIVGGVWGEIHFGRRARSAGDNLQADALVRIAEAQERAAAADQLAKEAARVTESERLERVKLEAQIAPRRLTPSHKRAVIAALCCPPSLSGKKVRVQSYSRDAEAALLGEELIDCFRSVGIEVDANLLSRGALGSVAVGVWVSGSMGERHDLIANRIFAALKSETALVTTIGDVPLSAGQYLVDRGGRVDATVFVGVKPVAR